MSSSYFEDGIISGLSTAPVAGYMQVRTSSGVGRLNGVEIEYNNKAMVVDDADTVYDRVDAIFITPSEIKYVAGTPGPSPVAPNHVDGETYFFLIATFTVPIGAVDSDQFTGLSYGGPGIDTNIYNYLIQRDFYYVLNKGFDLVDVDLDVKSNKIKTLSIGADSSDVEIKNIFFSVGYDDGNLLTGSNVTVSIINDTATFSSAQTHEYIGVGCIIRVGGIDYYIYKKINDQQWLVKTCLGESVNDLLPTSVTGIYYCYNSLYDAFNGTSPITLIVGYFLRTARYKINIACYAGSEVTTDNFLIRLFDTDENGFIKIFTPSDLSLECNIPQTHCANPDGTNFSILGDSSGTVINIFSNYTEINGMIIHGDGSTCVGLNNCHDINIKNNLLYSGISGVASNSDGHIDSNRSDNFITGGVNSDLWGSDISTCWSVQKYKDKYLIHHNSISPIAYESVLPGMVECEANFDFEFSIIQRSGAYTKMAVCDDASVVAEMVFSQDSLTFNTTTILRNHKYGCEYKFRIVRGGVISQDGIFTDTPSQYEKVSLYYFYDNKWNNISSDYTSMSGYYNFKIKSSGLNGIGYLKLWDSSDTNTLLDVGSNSNNIIVNNIVYDMDSNGIVSSGSDKVYNNTADECNGFGFFNRSSDDLINNIATQCADESFLNNENIQYCTSDDAGAGSMHKCISGATLEYVDNTSSMQLRNYRPTHDSIFIRGNGLSLTSQFKNDATNWDRDRLWDRGALEYIPKIFCFGISSFNNDIKIPCSYEIKELKHYSIIIFSKDQTDSRMAIGCDVVDEAYPFLSGCVLTKKLSSNKWIVNDYDGTPIPTRTGGVIKSIYVKNNHFEDVVLDIVGAQKRIIIAYYNDSFLNYDLELLETSTDVDHFVKIVAPYKMWECNQSNKHHGIAGHGATIGLINIGACHYTEIDGMVVESGIKSLNAGGVFVGYSIIKGNGIVISNFSLENYIFNNLIYECSGFGISVENTIDYANGVYDARNWSNVTILNNTVSLCRQAFHFYKSNHKYTATAYVKNNLFQYSTIKDFGCEYKNRKGNFLFKDNITRKLNFLDRVNGNYYLDEYTDFYAIDRASDKSSFFTDDITEASREPEKWDIGAFETLDISGYGNLSVGELGINITSAFNGIIPKTTILYLRRVGDDGDPEANFLMSVDPKVQFNSIEGTGRYALNAFVKNESLSGVMVDNLIIYVQGGETFGGTFTLFGRGSRTVVIATYPDEVEFGPSAILYNGPVVDDDSDQYSLEFSGIKVFSEAAAEQEFLINDTAATKLLKFTNSIVQVNNNAIAKECVVASVNSLLIYRNGSESNILKLSDSDPGGMNDCINSQIVSYYDGNLSFAISNNSDLMRNNLTYNFSGGGFSVPVESAGYDIENQNPQFKYVDIVEREFSINGIIDKSFVCEKTSPIYDAGYNAATIGDFDIVGNPRIYISGIVDIGPYELVVNNLVIKASDIEAIFQDKFFFTGGYFKTKRKVYKDLSITGRNEFCRESKIVIVLKESRRDCSYLSDKPNKIMFQYNAYFDLSTRSIILFKTDRYIGGLLKTIFDDDRYEFYFDDINNLLTVYVNNTYDKGLSIINNVKFGGSSVLL
jgi:hypothetical protein